MERENAEYIDFIHNVFYKDIQTWLDTLKGGTSSDIDRDTGRIYNDIVQLEQMFGTKMRQIDEAFRNLRETQQECKELKDTIEALRVELREALRRGGGEDKEEEGEGGEEEEVEYEPLTIHALSSSVYLKSFLKSWGEMWETMQERNSTSQQQHQGILEYVGKATAMCSEFLTSHNITVPPSENNIFYKALV
jgi:hypothetical protein